MLLLDADNPGELEDYLKANGWLDSPLEEVERAGEGNMNLVLRVRTVAGGAIGSAGSSAVGAAGSSVIVAAGGSVIVKQSRDWVEKYPDIAAPGDRICVEAAFYSAVAKHRNLASRMPRLLAFDEDNRVALLEDLGEAADFTDVYHNARIEDSVMNDLWDWLSALHALRLDTRAMPLLENRAMRELNHAHIFDIPLQHDNGLDLDAITPGLAERAAALQADDAYCARVRAYGARYLENGTTLLHGDYYPGSWLKHPDGVKIIDPEFGFFGPAEFDCGVFIAHLHLAGFALEAVDAAARHYRPPDDFSEDDARVYAGIEIMRRLIGVAQLPLSAHLARKSQLLELSRELVLKDQ
jgi:5-methylthioribose kinase